MKNMARRIIVSLIVTFMATSFLTVPLLATGWQPFQFSGKYEKYKYEARVDNHLLYHTFLVEPKDDTFEISYVFKLVGLDREDWEYGLSNDSFSWMNWISAIRPVLAAIFQEQEFKVGDKLIIPGIGQLACTGVQTLAGLEGKVFVLALAGSKAKNEFVIKESLPLPLRITIVDNEGGRDLDLKLVEYEAR